MEAQHILLVEDDPNLGAVLQEYLQLKDFVVTLCSDGESGFNAYRNGRFRICILDVMLPKRDGFTLARAIRDRDPDTAIIFLTAKSMKEDRIEGLTIGADDYITKPFSIEELLLRIQAILRRTAQSQVASQRDRAYRFGGFNLDVDNRELAFQGSVKRISAREADLLALLCAQANQTVKREHALKEIWGDDNYFNARSMDVYITRLRKHLKADPATKIVNVHGIGYRLITHSEL